MAVRKLRTSERTTFASCKQRWWWAYEEGLEPKVTAPALRFGTLVHKAMELRYPPGIKRGPHPAETFLQLYEKELEQQEAIGFRDEDGTWADAAEVGVGVLEEFINEYGKDERYKVISSEQTFAVNIGRGLQYVGTFDGVWQDRQTKQMFIKEWKTTASFWTSHLALDEQAGSYWAFAPLWLMDHDFIKDERQLTGILYTFLRKTKPDTRPKNEAGQYLNKDGSVSKVQPSPLIERHVVLRDKADRMNVRARAISQAREMEMIRIGHLELYKSPARFHCSGCPFIDPCELHEVGADYKPLLRAAYQKYDPYAAHLIAEEGKN